MEPLSPRRARFVEEYLLDLNPRAAAVRAGYKADGFRFTGYALLKIPEVAAAVRAAMEARAARVRLEGDMVVRELMALAFSDIRKVAHWRALAPTPGISEAAADAEPTLYDLQVVDSGDVDTASIAAIAAVRRSTGGSLSVRMHDKLPALALLGRHLGLFTPQLEVVAKRVPSKLDREYDYRMRNLSPEGRQAVDAAMQTAVAVIKADPGARARPTVSPPA